MTTAVSPLLRRALISVAVALVVAGAAACEPAPASLPAGSSPEGAHLVTLVNGFRAAHGVPALAEAGDASAKAQQHAEDMAAAGTIFHSSDLAAGIQSGWTALGENVAFASTLDQAQAALEASAPHRANLLKGSYDQLGVGVAHSADGRVFVTEIFVAR